MHAPSMAIDTLSGTALVSLVVDYIAIVKRAMRRRAIVANAISSQSPPPWKEALCNVRAKDRKITTFIAQR